MGVTYLWPERVEGTVGTGTLGHEYVDGSVGTGTLGRERGNGSMGMGVLCQKQLNNTSYWCPFFIFCGDFAIVLGLYWLCCILELCQQYFCRILLIGVFVSAVVCCVCHCFILLLWFCHVIWFTLWLFCLHGESRVTICCSFCHGWLLVTVSWYVRCFGSSVVVGWYTTIEFFGQYEDGKIIYTMQQYELSLFWFLLWFFIVLGLSQYWFCGIMMALQGCYHHDSSIRISASRWIW